MLKKNNTLLSLAFFLFIIVFTPINIQTQNNNIELKDIIGVTEREISDTVLKYWELSINGNLEESNELVIGAPLSYIDWKYSNKKEDIKKSELSTNNIINNERPIVEVADFGVGTVNTNVVDSSYLKVMKDWSKVINRNKISIVSINNINIDQDKAEVILDTKLNETSKSSFKLRVLLRQIDNAWKLVAIWD